MLSRTGPASRANEDEQGGSQQVLEKYLSFCLRRNYLCLRNRPKRHAVSRNDHSAGRTIEQVACVPCRDGGKNFASGLRAVKFLSLTLATTCLLGLVAGCGGNAPAGPDAVREPPALFLGPAPRPLGPA